MIRWALIVGVFALAARVAWHSPGYVMLSSLAGAAVAAFMLWGYERY